MDNLICCIISVGYVLLMHMFCFEHILICICVFHKVSVFLLHSCFVYDHHPSVEDRIFRLLLTLMSISEPSLLSGS